MAQQKLYTEEQVREAIRLTHSSNRRYLDWLEDDIVNTLTPIELPSYEDKDLFYQYLN